MNNNGNNNRIPASIETEKVILGSILLNNNLLYQAQEWLKVEEDFHIPRHRTIFNRMLSISEQQLPIDLITLSNELQKAGVFQQVGGAVFISELSDGVPRTDTIEPYLKILKSKSRLRRLRNAGLNIVSMVESEEDDSNILIEKAESLIFEIAEEHKHGGAEHVAVIASRLADYYEEKSQNPSKLIGLSTGYSDIDKRTSGLIPGLIIMAGRPGQGKTSVALNISCNVALAGGSVYFCSPESSSNQIVQRILASTSRIDSQRMREGRMTKDEWKSLTDTLGLLATTRFVIDDSADITPEVLLSRARQYKITNGLDLLVLDYIQLMARRLIGEKESRFMNLRAAVQYVSAYMVKISRILDVPVLGLAQLGREVDVRPGHHPLMSDLAESSSLEQDADLVIFLLREEKYEKTDENEGILKIIFGKFRDGSTANDIEMAFIEKYTRMEPLYRES